MLGVCSPQEHFKYSHFSQFVKKQCVPAGHISESWMFLGPLFFVSMFRVIYIHLLYFLTFWRCYLQITDRPFCSKESIKVFLLEKERKSFLFKVTFEREVLSPTDCPYLKLSLVIHRFLINDLQTAGNKELRIPHLIPGEWPLCGCCGPLSKWWLSVSGLYIWMETGWPSNSAWWLVNCSFSTDTLQSPLLC